MAPLATLIADPDSLLNAPDTFHGLVPPVNLAGSVDTIDQSSRSATLRLVTPTSMFGNDSPSISAKLIDTGLTWTPGQSLPVGGQIAPIEFGTYIVLGWDIMRPRAQFTSRGVTHQFDFATPISAADLYATGYDRATLFHGSADSTLGYARNHTLDGSGGVDTLLGGDGADHLIGQNDADSLSGAA